MNPCPWHTLGHLLHGHVTENQPKFPGELAVGGQSPEHSVSIRWMLHLIQPVNELVLGLPLGLHPGICNWPHSPPCPISAVFCSLLSDAVLLQKISDGIPLPPAQVPPSRLHAKQEPGCPPGQGPQRGLCEPLPCLRGVWGGWLPAAALAARVLVGYRRAVGPS